MLYKLAKTWSWEVIQRSMQQPGDRSMTLELKVSAELVLLTTHIPKLDMPFKKVAYSKSGLPFEGTSGHLASPTVKHV